MVLSWSRLKKGCYLYLALPAVLFLVGFLKPWLGIPAALLALLGVFLCIRSAPMPHEEKLLLTRRALLLLAVLAVLWCWLGGQGGLYVQKDDWTYRNAVFRDLITHRWPVEYPAQGRALVYYVGYWLPAALVGKAVLGLGGGAEAAFFVGNLALWAWTALGILLILLLLAYTVRAARGRALLLTAAVLVLFSGLDLVGTLLTGGALSSHLEWWAKPYQYSSITTCLFWVFNQAVIPWLATLCFLQEPDCRNYAFLGFCVFLCGPMPFCGLAVYLAAVGVQRLLSALRAGRLTDWLREIFTPQNLIGLLVLFPPVALYFLANSQVEGAGLTLNTGAAPFWLYLLFFVLEAGLYLLLTVRENRGLLYWVTGAVLLLCPWLRMGGYYDFCMRASLPALFLLMVFCLRSLLEGLPLRRLSAWVLAACLLVGAATPGMELLQTFHKVWYEKQLVLPSDDIVTFDQPADSAALAPYDWCLDNFSAYDYQDSLFFKTIAR